MSDDLIEDLYAVLQETNRCYKCAVCEVCKNLEGHDILCMQSFEDFKKTVKKIYSVNP